MTKTALLLLALTAGLLANGCGRDNGLPQELTGHLADRGIKVALTRAGAPLSSRGGYVVASPEGCGRRDAQAGFRCQRVPARIGKVLAEHHCAWLATLLAANNTVGPPSNILRASAKMK